MAEMLIDGAKLDACLDAEADAIRAKTGGSADIAFDFANNKGFADAIAAIPSGGGGGGGWNVDVQTIEVTGNTASANRMFDNFVLVAQINQEDIPAVADIPRNSAMFVTMFFFNGKMLMGATDKKVVTVATAAAGASTKNFTITNGNSISVGETTIGFSPYWALSGGLMRGTWTVMQVEIPSNVPFFSFADV